MDEILKSELIEIYWSEISLNYLSEEGMDRVKGEDVKFEAKADEYYDLYNNLLPYLKKELLNMGLRYCERKFTYYDPSKNPNPIPFFKKLLTNVVIAESMGFLYNIKYSIDPTFYRKPPESSIQHHDALYKKLNSEYLIDQLVN